MKKFLLFLIILCIGGITLLITGCEKENLIEGNFNIEERSYGIYFEDKTASTDIKEVRDYLYSIFDEASDRFVKGEDMSFNKCNDGCQYILPRMFFPSMREKAEVYKFILTDLYVNKFTKSSMSISFQHHDIIKLTKDHKTKFSIQKDFDESMQDLYATFEKQNGRWTMTSISLYEPYERFNTQGERYFSTVLVTDLFIKLQVGDAEKISSLDQEIELRGTHARTTTKNYARNYTIHNNSIACNGYNNTQYKCLSPNDCANLVSQSLYAGGMPFANPYNNSTSSSSWWHKNNGTSTTTDDTYSISWSTANGLYNHLISSGRGVVTINLQSMNIGDVVFAKWVQKSSGSCYYNSTYDHAMVVTGLVYSGSSIADLLLTYHTNDRRDKNLYANIIPESPVWDCVNYPSQCKIPNITFVKMDESFGKTIIS